VKTETTALTAPEIAAWVTGMVQQLDRNLVGDVREDLTSALRADTGSVRAGFPVLATLALLDDCLRVAHLAMDADGLRQDDEIERTLPLAEVAARKYFQVLPAYEAFGEELGRDQLADFLSTHAADRGTFGGAHPLAWRGLELCKLIAARANNATLTRDHERMLVRVMETVLAERKSAAEDRVRQTLRDLFEPEPSTGEDPRAIAFCRNDGPAVFSSVAYGSQLWERDPFDVPSIHAEARELFHRQVEHAITPIRHGAGHGRTLLVLGRSGSGKTHLMRAFRSHVHGDRLGYVGYLQMTSEVGDYARYVLHNLIDSLERPYDAPALTESGLMYMSNGLAEHDSRIGAADLEKLRTAELPPDELTHFVGGLVSRLLRVPELEKADSDLVQALLLLQRRDAALERRVVKFLRGDVLTAHESALLGGLVSRNQPEDPQRTIAQLAHLMYHLHQAALVLLVDQVEDTLPQDDAGTTRTQRAIDVLRKIADGVPSAVVVIACLEDAYAHIKTKLTQSTVDRLERDPAPVRLATERRREEVEEMVARRLEFLYGALDAAWREDEPIYPFTAEALDATANQRARDCLAYFNRYQENCIRAGRLVDRPQAGPVRAAPPPSVDLDRLWNDARLSATPVPDDDAELLAALARGIQACALEVGVPIKTRLDHEDDAQPRLLIHPPSGPPRVVAVCNRAAQGGHLGEQIDSLRRATPEGSVSIAVRTSEWTFGPKSALARRIGEIVAAGGAKVSLTDAELRSLAGFEQLTDAHGKRGDFHEWRRQRRPVGELPVIQRLTGIEPGAPVLIPIRQNTAPGVVALPRVPAPAQVDSPARATAAPARGGIRLGVTSTMKAEPVVLPPEQLLSHAVVLGAPGSGKTTIALHVVEQLLARGVSALLVDRRGELARYASAPWWDERPEDPEIAARKDALRGKVAVAVYTPGDANGRPLRLPVIPSGMAEMTTQERDQVAKTAASGLAAMMQYGRGESFRRREAILKKAIELHAETGGTLEQLVETIGGPDPALLAEVGNASRLFGTLAEDLDTLRLQRGDLLGGDGEELDVPAMLAGAPGVARLVIISTGALDDISVVQFWVSRLLIELARMVRARPQRALSTVVFFDDADAYLPAVGVPPTKEPMFDLLRRARTGGLGLLLASQDVADFDYNARNNVGTWLLGRVSDDRAVEKMRNLIASYPNVATRLSGQAPGGFFVLDGVAARELRAERALLPTQELSTAEIAALARETAGL
jgi:polynucleotide 5'-kinase involved in rRNA processing